MILVNQRKYQGYTYPCIRRVLVCLWTLIADEDGVI